ncbi:MAG: OmpA family protein [Nitrospiraceae bacterium]
MSKTMEQGSLTSGSPAGRVGQIVQAPKEDKGRGGHQFGFKEIGALLGVTAVMIGIVGYGVYSQRSRAGAESRIASIAEPMSVSPVEPTVPLNSAIAQPVSQPLLVSTIPQGNTPEPVPAETQTEPKHADIYFDFGKSRLRADAVAILQQHADMLKKDHHWAVLIQGYADQHGPTEYNRSLALRRAESVKQFLVELGVAEASMKVVSLGKQSAICDDQSRNCQRLNRRVHVEMVKLEAAPAVTPVATTMNDEANVAQAVDPSSDDESNQKALPTSTDQP